MMRLLGLTKSIDEFFADKAGATSIEYAVIASMVSIVILGAVTSIGTTLRDDLFGSISAGFE